MPNRQPFSLDDLRLHLAIRLAVAPRFWFRDLWAPKNRSKDVVRDQLTDHLVHGLYNLEMVRLIADDEPDPFATAGARSRRLPEDPVGKS